MKDFYCIELTLKTPFVEKITFHSHIYLEDNKIEIKILLKKEKDFARKYMIWFSEDNSFEYFSNYATGKIYKEEKEITGVSFNGSKILRITSEQEDENRNRYFTITIDKIILYKKPLEIEKEFAKIYLNRDGFDLVKSFYSIFTGLGNDGKVDIARMRGMGSFYKVGKAKFRPEFEFNVSDSKEHRSPKIDKIPILKFYFPDTTSDEEVLKYFSIACKICSFYLGNNIEFDRAVICRKNHRLIYRDTLQTKFTLNVSSLNWILNVHGIDGFLKLNWQKNYLKNIEKLNEAITNYTHARLLDTNSKFMLLYNIIDICMGGNKQIAEKFQLSVSTKKKNQLYREAFSIIKKTISENDHEDFEKKWNVIQQKLAYKPMKSPLNEFIKSNNIDIDKLEVSINVMKQIRDDIFHGSVDSKTELIKNANIELFRITPILILNLLGIKEWRQRE